MRLSWPKIILLIIFLCGGLALGIQKNHQAHLSQVMVTMPVNSEVSIYNDLGGDGAYNYNPGSKPLFTLTSSQKILLSIGTTYDFVISDPSNIYRDHVTKSTIAYGTRVLIQPSYTNSKLDSLLPAYRASALSALFTKYPATEQNYIATKDQLFMLGDWYGALLQPKDNSLDTVRVIMHKTDSSWSVVVTPDLSIGEPSNPNIPAEVVEGTDNL